MILIDTCVLLWLSAEPGKISRAAARALNESAPVFVSSISAFEIGLKAARGALTLPKRIDAWFPEFLKDREIESLPVTAEIAAAATLLPPIHNDPFDRIIIATAKVEGLTLLTPDPGIRKYPDLVTAW